MDGDPWKSSSRTYSFPEDEVDGLEGKGAFKYLPNETGPPGYDRESIDPRILKYAVLVIGLLLLITGLDGLVYWIRAVWRYGSFDFLSVSTALNLTNNAVTTIVGYLLLMVARGKLVLGGSRSFLHRVLLIIGAFLVVRGVIDILVVADQESRYPGYLDWWPAYTLVYALAYVVCGLLLIRASSTKSSIGSRPSI